MIYRIIILLCFFTKIASAQNATIQYWKYSVNGNKKKMKVCNKSNQTFIPFVNIRIDIALLDSLSSEGEKYDSLLTLFSKNDTAIEPLPVVSNIEGKAILFKEQTKINTSNIQYKVYSFLLSNTNEINEHNCYEFYYLKEVGVISVFHIVLDEQHLLRNWDRYLLVKIKGKDKSVPSKSKLSNIVQGILQHCGCG